MNSNPHKCHLDQVRRIRIARPSRLLRAGEVTNGLIRLTYLVAIWVHIGLELFVFGEWGIAAVSGDPASQDAVFFDTPILK